MMNKNFNSQIIKYIFFGALNTLITFILYIFLIKLDVNYIVASTVCYIIGVIEGFILNGLFVFNEKLKFSGLSKYTLVYIVSYSINIFTLYLCVDLFGVNEIFAQMIVIMFVTLLNFRLVKWLVF